MNNNIVEYKTLQTFLFNINVVSKGSKRIEGVMYNSFNKIRR